MSEPDHVEEYCRAFGVEEPTFTLGHLVASGGLCAPATGTCIVLDGGTLDLGLVRDSVLSDDRSFVIFGETFE